MREWLRLFFGGCDHKYPVILHGWLVYGRFPDQIGFKYKECLYCRKRESIKP